jgi:hypothetical protein
VVPALIVGIAVYALAGGGGGGNGAGLLDSFIRLGPGGGSEIESFEGELPPGFPDDIPAYPGAKLVVSFRIKTDQGANYFAIYQTSDQPAEVLEFYQENMDEDPWQVEAVQSESNFGGLGFTRPDDADVQGDVSVNRSELDDKTSIYVTFQDLTPTGSRQEPESPFELPRNLALPPGFPADIPIFKGREATTVTETYFERGPGTISYLITFLTKQSQDDVIDFYKDEFKKRGWQVTDTPPSSNSRFELNIDFVDGPRQEVQGSIRADSFDDDPDYTRVDMLLQVSATRGRGN